MKKIDLHLSPKYFKKFLILSSIVLLALAFTTGYFYGEYQDLKLQKTRLTPTPFHQPSLWTTYNNDLYKFSLNYPDHWTLTTSETANDLSPDDPSSGYYVDLASPDQQGNMQIIVESLTDDWENRKIELLNNGWKESDLISHLIFSLLTTTSPAT